MSIHSHWSWRRAGIATASLALVLSVAAVSAGPRWSPRPRRQTSARYRAVATAKAKPGAHGKHDPTN